MTVGIQLAFVALMCALAMTGCKTIGSGEDLPARVTNPTIESRAALQQAVNDAMNMNVLIADDALTDSSLLILERSPPRSMQNLPATGRNMDSAIQLRLVINGNDCILVDTRDAARYLLENTTCVKE